METRTIAVRVDAETADAYEASSEVDRRKIDLLINLKLKEVVKKVRPLEEVMEEISRKAQERGLTPEILSAILAES
ncbi:hypothetical protein XM38_045160 [Halomicronema hongdechloris C2206]|uniref:Uncharacterized protein n=1 Tax=Halomicronema hongdechloris C2206 TaxID=1641165 RepID=A0A1Z3HTA8_9CYAN|nr:hypothetical protein [Halomicronema hongdechloris]ASC73548.1 hypothetical protein XM38_045160 [Halomicronema hongdechloris C2206]